MLFSFPEYAYISKALCSLTSLQAGQFSITRRENQELHAAVQSPVSGEHCFILGTIAPPDQQMTSTLLLAHTLKKEGAKRVTAILPYLAYAREDHLIKPGASFTTAWVGAVVKASGLDEIWAVDVHSQHDKEIIPVVVESFSPAGLIAECVSERGLAGASFVATDHGGIARCEAVKLAAGVTSGDIVYFNKVRTPSGIVHSEPIGRVGSRAVIVDDILDTGGTLVSACEKLVQAGAAELYIFVTHGLFTGELWRGLWSHPVKHLFCTDTVPACAIIDEPRITVLPIGPWLGEKIAARIDAEKTQWASVNPRPALRQESP
jgi:ribose-phosphate pyrophosphokinase